MMRENMAEVLAKTRSELKVSEASTLTTPHHTTPYQSNSVDFQQSGFHQLDSRDMLSPDNVFATTTDHSSEVMFPRSVRHMWNSL